MKFSKTINKEFTTAASNDAKIGLLSTISKDGYPHIALISSLTASGMKEISWGQFTRGLTKQYMKENKKTGFLVLLTTKEWWTGKATYNEELHTGKLYEFFNNKPMFRYNSYFGMGAVHTEKLVEVSEKQKLSICKILFGSMKSKCLKKYIENKDAIKRLPQYGIDLAKPLTTLKFLSYVDKDGYPRVFPAMQSAVIDANHIGISNNTNPEFINQIPNKAKVALFIANFDLVSIMVQGSWSKNAKGGIINIEKVYNSMLPVPKYIYPEQPLPNVYGVQKH